MKETKIKVPKKMLEAVRGRYGVIYSSGFHLEQVNADLEAALLWLDGELFSCVVLGNGRETIDAVRRIFHAPEPETPPEIIAMLQRREVSMGDKDYEKIVKLCAEAFEWGIRKEKGYV
jgi:hypothetical protein